MKARVSGCCLPQPAPRLEQEGARGRGGEPGRQRPRQRAEVPEEASLVDDVVLLHHSTPVPLKLLDSSLLGLSGLYVPLLQVPELRDNSQWNCPPDPRPLSPAQLCPRPGPISLRQLHEGRTGPALRGNPRRGRRSPAVLGWGLPDTDLWSGRSRVSVEGSDRFSSAVSSFSSKAN